MTNLHNCTARTMTGNYLHILENDDYIIAFNPEALRGYEWVRWQNGLRGPANGIYCETMQEAIEAIPAQDAAGAMIWLYSYGEYGQTRRGSANTYEAGAILEEIEEADAWDYYVTQECFTAADALHSLTDHFGLDWDAFETFSDAFEAVDEIING